jgi:DNA-binding response OmpR family regulator
MSSPKESTSAKSAMQSKGNFQETLLLIDDDLELGEMLCEYLARFGYPVVHYAEGSQIRERMRAEKLNPALIILDIMLPGQNGFEICKELRQESNTPIIFLSARGEVTDRVVGLELGADDYLPKPFEPRELVARIQTVLRRGMGRKVGQVLLSHDLRVDLGKREAYFKELPLDLTTTEFELLSLFLAHPGTVLNRDQIQDQLRGISWDAFDRSIDVTVSRLRQKLAEDPKKPKYLKTVWGSGYLFVGDVTDAQ